MNRTSVAFGSAAQSSGSIQTKAMDLFSPTTGVVTCSSTSRHWSAQAWATICARARRLTFDVGAGRDGRDGWHFCRMDPGGGRATVRRRAAALPLAWPVVHSAAEPPLRGRPLDAFPPTSPSCRRCCARPKRVYSITLSARATNIAGTVTPIALAVLRLITSSNLVGCSTGMSAILVPRKSSTICRGIISA
jgi:hypothetical protein